MRAPGQIALMLAMPTAILATACGWLASTRRDPTSLLVSAFALFVLAIGYRHVRFAMYAELGAALAVAAWCGSLLRPRASASPGKPAGRPGGAVLVTAATAALAAGPFVVSDLFESASWNPETGPSCTTRLAAPALERYAGRIVLADFSQSPEVLFFSRAVTVAGPYHRAETRILASLDAMDETRFADAMPASFGKTGAVAVLVCPAWMARREGTLAAALAAGRVPP